MVLAFAAAHNLNWPNVALTLATAVTTGLGVPAGIGVLKNTLILPFRIGNAGSQGVQLAVSFKQINEDGQGTACIGAATTAKALPLLYY